MLKRLLSTFTCILILVISFAVVIDIKFFDIFGIHEGFTVNYEDIAQINSDKKFGNYVSVDILNKEVSGSNGDNTVSKLVFKLFGLIPIKEVSVNIAEYEPVFIGGIPLGFSIKTKGLIVVGYNSILTKNGTVNTLELSDLKIGDIIIGINDIPVDTIEDIERILNDKSSDSELTVNVLRKDSKREIKLKPALDMQSNKYKLGLWVRDDASGVGTLTYIKKDNRYGALGHPIVDGETGTIIPTLDGNVYDCSVVGLNKGAKGVPGELRGIFLQGKNSKGNIDKNCRYGVYGKFNEGSEVVGRNKEVEIGGRLSVKPGKATLVSYVNNAREEYEIEIIKANYQPKSSDKSFVFRVKDKELLNLTGGVIQGMSGSPILQNGKLIGAVTHVFVSDPTKGYGIYIDWMLDE